MKKVCVVTGSRAEYGILKPIIQKLSCEQNIELQIVATGMHLSTEFGLTYKEIENDGYKINEKIEIVLSSDTAVGVSKAMGLGMISFAESFQRLQPDLVILLGDRYEIFSVASAAMIGRIPIAHLHGGELTQGAIDESIRHAITKMSYLHFTSTESYRKRVIQLGESPDRVYNVGALGVENIKKISLMSKEEIINEVGIDFNNKVAMVTFHPITLESKPSKEQFKELLEALADFNDLKIIFTKANADADGRIINQMIDEYVNEHGDNCKAFISMGQKRYLSALKHSTIVIGNSSSGIIEAPSFGIPVINIGDRQKGRIHSASVINCPVESEAIRKAIASGLEEKFIKDARQATNPYEKNNTSNQILQVIKEFLLNEPKELKKRFYDLKEV